MKIYTKKGDRGKTSLFGGVRVLKSDTIFYVLGSLDELNALIGTINIKSNVRIKKILKEVQEDLFLVGAVLAGYKFGKADKNIFDSRVTAVEKNIDYFDSKLPKLKNFILPGGSEAASRIHLSRAVCRRFERDLVNYTASKRGKKYKNLVKYANRLSDLLFVLARFINYSERRKEIIWKL